MSVFLAQEHQQDMYSEVYSNASLRVFRNKRRVHNAVQEFVAKQWNTFEAAGTIISMLDNWFSVVEHIYLSNTRSTTSPLICIIPYSARMSMLTILCVDRSTRHYSPLWPRIMDGKRPSTVIPTKLEKRHMGNTLPGPRTLLGTCEPQSNSKRRDKIVEISTRWFVRWTHRSLSCDRREDRSNDDIPFRPLPILTNSEPRKERRKAKP